jgi:hypothetical protein
MNAKIVRLAALLVALTLLLLCPAGAARIDFTPSAVTVQKSATTNITLVLDEAPSGLSGYDMVIRFSPSGVAGITEVSYPSWASLFNTTRNADGSVRISGVDINRQVEAGSTGVTLATLTIQGLSGGTSSILMESVNMDADGGDLISPVLSTGRVSVPGGGGTSSGGGGGGGSGDSYVPTTTRTATPTVTQSPTTTTTEPPSTQSLAVTQTPTQPTPVTTLETPQPTGTSAATIVKGETIEIPWGLVVLGIVILGVVLAIAFLAWQKERKE